MLTSKSFKILAIVTQLLRVIASKVNIVEIRFAKLQAIVVMVKQYLQAFCANARSREFANKVSTALSI